MKRNSPQDFVGILWGLPFSPHILPTQFSIDLRLILNDTAFVLFGASTGISPNVAFKMTVKQSHEKKRRNRILLSSTSLNIEPLENRTLLAGVIEDIPFSSSLAIDIEAARNQILEGVTTIHSGVQPGRMVTYGPNAFAIAMYPGEASEGPMISAASWVDGRVIAVPDHQMLEMGLYGNSGTTGQFYRNSLAWLTNTAATDIKIVTPDQGTSVWLQEQGYTNVTVSSNYTTSLINADVLVGWLGSNPSEANLDAIRNFVRSGGGLFLAEYGAGYSWWWGKVENEVPGSRLLREAGIGFPYGNRWETELIDVTNRAVGQVTSDTVFDVLADSNGFTQQVIEESAAVMDGMFAVLPVNDPLLLDLQDHYETKINQINPSPTAPLTDSFDKALIKREMNLIKNLPPNEVVAHRTAEAVYGTIDVEAERLSNHTFSLDTSKTGWLTTGMYSPPGELVTLTFPQSMIDRGYTIQVSGHVDDISSRSSWNRVPLGVARSFPIDTATVNIASAFGGAIYVNVGDLAGGTAPGLGHVPIQVSGAIRAPFFELGKTTDQSWADEIRSYPAPYAEFVCDGVAFSVPSDWIRNLSNPTALMTYWNDAVEIMDYVGGLESLRTGPERFNVDAQISVGYLHAGYPIQGPASATASQWLVDLETLQTRGNWGYFHELGHEMQRRPDRAWGFENPYTFAGDVEVTVNIFANAAFEHLVSKDSSDYWSYSADPILVMDKAALTVYDQEAATFDDKDPYPFYYQLADGFDWSTYRAVLSGYSRDQDTNPSALPQTYQERKDQWLIRWSQTSGHNMVSYMVDHWKLEVSQEAIDFVNNLGLPSWMPLLAEDDIFYFNESSIDIDVLANDIMLDSSAQVIDFSTVSHGTLEAIGEGRFSYTPEAGFYDQSSFTYTVENSAGIRDVKTVLLVQQARAPSAPINLIALAGDSEVSLTWDAPLSDGGLAITGYVLSYKASNDAAWVTVNAGFNPSYTILGLQNGMTYHFRVAAINAVGIGTYSQAVAGTTLLETISVTGSVILQKDSIDNLYVNMQPLIYQEQTVTQSFFNYFIINATSNTFGNQLLLQPLGTQNNQPTHRLLADNTWRINGIFNALQNESSPILEISGREVSDTLNIATASGAYDINGVNNPTLIFRRGQTYLFNLNTSGHPFYLQTTGSGYQSANIYRSGFTGNGQTSGEHQWVVPEDAPDEIYYQCEFHPVMFGKIIVID